MAGSGTLRVNARGARQAMITEHDCWETHGLGPGRVVVLWARRGAAGRPAVGVQGSNGPLSLWGGESVEQHVQTTASNLRCFKYTLSASRWGQIFTDNVSSKRYYFMCLSSSSAWPLRNIFIWIFMML